MSIDETIAEWIEQLKEGDAEAAEKLWQHYFQRIVEQARRRLEGGATAGADEEDVALSVFRVLCVGARDGQFPQLTDRESLWCLLAAITANKSADLIRHENRQKRGGPGTGAEIDQPRRSRVSLDAVIQARPTPEFVAEMSEQFQLLLEKLRQADDPDLIEIALCKMQGASTTEIARQRKCVRRTVQRKLEQIRRIWEQECE